MAKGTTLTSYDPSLREKIAWWVADRFGGGDRSRRNYLNEKVGGAIDLIPGVGDALGAEDTIRSAKEGDYYGAAVNSIATLAGLIPGAGDMVSKGVKSSGKKLFEMYHGTRVPFDELRGDVKDAGLHVTRDPTVAAKYAGMDLAEIVPEDLVGGRILPLIVDPGRSFNGFKPRDQGNIITDTVEWTDPRQVAEAINDNTMGGADPELSAILKDMGSGVPVTDAFKRKGYDSFSYQTWPNNEDTAAIDYDPRHALMLFDPARATPRLSPRGISLDYRPAKKKFEKGDPETWRDLMGMWRGM